MPEWAREAALAAFKARDPSVLVLDCAYDSLIDQPGRAGNGKRTLRFSGSGVRVDVDVSASRTMSLAVQVLPPEHVQIAVRGTENAISVETDDDGLVCISPFAPGTFSLILTWPGSVRPRARTAWMRL